VFCIYLTTNNDLCHLENKLIGFYNRDEKCLQRGTDWGFKLSSMRFIFKGIKSAAFRKSKMLLDRSRLRISASITGGSESCCLLGYDTMWPEDEIHPH